MEERLQKILSNLGVAARRKAEQLIAHGKVTVNGKVAVLGQKADPDKDFILVENRRIKVPRKIYIMFNKPRDYVCSLSDEGSKRSMMRLIKVKERIYPVGRLDFDTEGLILLTNDGEFANRIMHPRYEVEKTYVARLDRGFKRDDIRKLKNGVLIEDYQATARAQYLFEKDPRVLELTIHEGKKHIIKNMMRALGYKVIYLARIKIGPLYLGDLRKGKYRDLSKAEMEKIMRAIGLGK
jgi:23S rRNA pseudouridine2605 synthase